MSKVQTKKLVLTAMLACISYVLSTFVYFPRMAPFQHMCNVIGAVFLGPYWGLACAFLTGCMRMLLNGSTIQAIVGAVIGAFLSGLMYRFTRRIAFTVAGEVIGTGIISALLVYPLMVRFYGLPPQTPFYTFIIAYVPSSCMGAAIGAMVLGIMKKSGYMQSLLRELNGGGIKHEAHI